MQIWSQIAGMLCYRALCLTPEYPSDSAVETETDGSHRVGWPEPRGVATIVDNYFANHGILRLLYRCHRVLNAGDMRSLLRTAMQTGSNCRPANQ